MGEWSGTRLYLGNLPKGTQEKEIEDFFKEIGHGTITEIKLMDGFGFIQYDSADDAKDIVPTFHGRDFKGHSLIVQFARGTRHRDGPRDYAPPGGGGGGAGFTARPRRTPFRMNISGLPPDTSWQDLKDFARKSNENVVYSDVSRDRDGRGTVEFETGEDLNRAVAQLDKTEYRGYRVSCVAEDLSATGRFNGGGGGGGYGPPPRGRSRSPPRGGGGGGGGYRGRYSPPPPRSGGYSPPRGGAPYSGSRGRYESPPHASRYRERSPRRDPYYGGGGGPRERSPPPPRRPPPMDDYPPPPPRSSSGYDAPPRDYPPRDRGYEEPGYHHSSRSGGGRYDDRGYRSPPRGRTPPPARPPPSSTRPYDDYDRGRRY